MDASSSSNLLKVFPQRLHGRRHLPPRQIPLRRPSQTSCSPASAGAAPLPPTSSADTPHAQREATRPSETRKEDYNSNDKKRRPLMASFIDAVEDKINRSLEAFPLQPAADPEYVLAGNFAPVDELPPTPCRIVKGSVPSCLCGGAYVRIGPNPRYRPRGPYHMFDGDGMVHSLLLQAEDASDGAPATYCSRYVRTQKYEVESSAGAPVFPNFFAFRGFAGVMRGALALMKAMVWKIDPWMGATPTNTNLFLFHDRLLALGEPDYPYDVHVSPIDGDVSTVGRWKIDNKVFGRMAAHPKKDPVTGEVSALRYGLGPMPPFLSYFWFDRHGKKQPDVPIKSVPRMSVFHDFAITKNYAVLVDSQMVIDPLAMAVSGGHPLFRFHQGKVSRVGVLPRQAKPGDEPMWFDLPGFNPLHVVNAWEDGDAVVLVAPNWFNMEHLVSRMELAYGHMEMVRIDLKMKVATRAPLSVRNVDFATMNPAFLGRKCRYIYVAVGDDVIPKLNGVAKLDLELAKERRECVVASRKYEAGCFGGEWFFVAKDEGVGGGDEDDGYLVSFVHDEKKGESRFVVMDAKSPELETVAEVALPRRVPYGFHGIFLRQSELRDQRLYGL